METQLTNFNLENKFSSFLEHKKNKIIQIKTIINEILTREDDIPDNITLNKIFDDIKSYKLIIEEKDSLNDYLKINDWLEKVKLQISIKFNFIKDSLLKKDDSNKDTKQEKTNTSKQPKMR